MLRIGGVAHVVDVRAMPRSRHNPQFNDGVLSESLAACSIGYSHEPDLAGLRHRNYDVPDSVNAYWYNRSFHNYADYALSDRFQTALGALIERGQRETCAVMCSEAVWWRCHRRIIADHLIHRGESVAHLMDHDRVYPAELTSAAVTARNGDLVYPGGD